MVVVPTCCCEQITWWDWVIGTGLAVVIALVIWGLVRLYEWWENGGGL